MATIASYDLNSLFDEVGHIDDESISPECENHSPSPDDEALLNAWGERVSLPKGQGWILLG